MRLRKKARSKLSFLFESASTSETIARYSFIGTDPRKTLKTGEGHGEAVDPMPLLRDELAKSRVADVPGLNLPPLTGGAIGYVGYDCVRYFEPRTKRDLKDVLQIPESLFMLFDTVVAFDHFSNRVTIITYLEVPPVLDELEKRYDKAKFTIRKLVNIIRSDGIPLPEQGPIETGRDFTSNKGQDGYEGYVRTLRKHIGVGDIIQAVPSHRCARPTSLVSHPIQ